MCGAGVAASQPPNAHAVVVAGGAQDRLPPAAVRVPDTLPGDEPAGLKHVAALLAERVAVAQPRQARNLIEVPVLGQVQGESLLGLTCLGVSPARRPLR